MVNFYTEFVNCGENATAETTIANVAGSPMYIY